MKSNLANAIESTQVLVVDAGGQYCHLIARRVREAGVFAAVCAPANVMHQLQATSPKAIIISGGPSSVYDADAPRVPIEVFGQGIPVLGICYGHQLMAHALGGRVRPAREHEYGETRLEILGEDSIFKGLRHQETVWMSHGDDIDTPPKGFSVLARTPNCRVAAMWNRERRLYGLQFHPEVAHTVHGQQILTNFLFKVCQCNVDWSLDGIVARLTQEIRAQVGNRNVLFFVSGGVDSSVAFALCSEALGPNRVVGVFIDTGFMRKAERNEIEGVFARRGWHNVRFLDRSKTFVSALDRVTDPEEKRHRIGDAFLEVQREVESELGLGAGKWMLGQGTIYPDTIESGGSALAQVIKTHHNRVPAIERLIEQGLVVEPLREFYKDEVREIGRLLGLPEQLVGKHPFPGPGLAVRCLCSGETFHLQQESKLSEIAKSFHLDAWQVPLRTVGVQGDHRSYSNLVILSGEAGLEEYGLAARHITREIRHTNRVVFLVQPRDGSVLRTACGKESYISGDRLDRLREADAACHDLLAREGLMKEVWQFPVVSLPLTLGSGETIALRPVSSTDAMTARYANLPMKFIRRVAESIMKIQGIDMVLYDVTDKPPATIEWE